jgi:hypothetical protein
LPKFALKAPYTAKHVADAVLNEWIDAARDSGRDIDQNNIENMIRPILVSDGGIRVVKVLADDKPSATRKIRLSIAWPEPPDGQSVEDWVKAKWPNATKVGEFGTAIL